MSKIRVPSFFRSLRARVGLLIFACVAFLSLVVITVSDRQLSTASSDAGKADLISIARTFSSGFSAAGSSDPALLRQRVEALRAVNPDIDGVSVYASRAGTLEPIASTGASVPPHVEGPEAQRMRTGDFVYRVDEGKRRAELTYVVRKPNGKVTIVGIAYNLKPFDAVLKPVDRFIIAAVIAGTALSLLVWLVLGRGVFTPINKLRAATKRISKGELSTRLHWNRTDEIGALASDFDLMAAALEEHKRLEALALEDPLTGLLNHRAFQERVYAELTRARREGYPVALVALDIDHFKNVNDTVGHAVGDRALRLVAETIVQMLRPSDLSGRVGGDEFMLALHGMDAAEARHVVERLRDAVASVDLGTGSAITVSAGIAEFPHHATEKTELMRLADGAMYWSKSHGRDRCSIYSPDTDEALSVQEDAERVRRDSLVRTVHALARAVDAKDGYTHLHSQRVAFYAATLAAGMGLDYEQVELIRTAGILHDVGKIGIPDAILLKPDKLTDEEFDEMKRHSELGRDIIAGAGMPEVASWVLHLHEHYGGRGYPDGLAANEIPLASRILHAADALEAMTSPRVYRPALDLETALAELKRCQGTQFDPAAAAKLLELVRSGGLQLGGVVPLIDDFDQTHNGPGPSDASLRKAAS